MKKLPEISALSAIAISIILLLCALNYVEWQKNKNEVSSNIDSTPALSSSEIEELLAEGKALEPDKQAFENIIRELLLISFDDKRGGFGGRTEIDMMSRKKYFSPESLLDYDLFVQKQKYYIDDLGVDSGAPYTCSADFKHRSQNYIQDKSGHTLFTAEGKFWCGAWDSQSRYGKFIISVSTLGDVTHPENMKIIKWDVKDIEPIYNKRKFSAIEIDGKDYGVVKISYSEYLKAVDLLKKEMKGRRNTENLKDCSFILDMPAGTARGNHSYGGYCKFESHEKTYKAVICHDIMLGRLKIEPFDKKRPSNIFQDVVKFTVENCYGG